jgi:hypothetical protein
MSALNVLRARRVVNTYGRKRRSRVVSAHTRPTACRDALAAIFIDESETATSDAVYLSDTNRVTAEHSESTKSLRPKTVEDLNTSSVSSPVVDALKIPDQGSLLDNVIKHVSYQTSQETMSCHQDTGLMPGTLETSIPADMRKGDEIIDMPDHQPEKTSTEQSVNATGSETSPTVQIGCEQSDNTISTTFMDKRKQLADIQSADYAVVHSAVTTKKRQTTSTTNVDRKKLKDTYLIASDHEAQSNEHYFNHAPSSSMNTVELDSMNDEMQSKIDRPTQSQTNMELDKNIHTDTYMSLEPVHHVSNTTSDATHNQRSNVLSTEQPMPDVSLHRLDDAMTKAPHPDASRSAPSLHTISGNAEKTVTFKRARKTYGRQATTDAAAPAKASAQGQEKEYAQMRRRPVITLHPSHNTLQTYGQQRAFREQNIDDMLAEMTHSYRWLDVERDEEVNV